MAKTFYKILIKIGKYSIAIQRFNKGYKNLPTNYYKNGIRKFYNENEITIQITIGTYKLIFIKEI